jgi:coatomer protein complex subunit gamma
VLRRLVYLGIKELSNIAEDVIIVTSSLTKDMTGKEDCYRAAAIRALCTITDPVMLQVSRPAIFFLMSWPVDMISCAL